MVQMETDAHHLAFLLSKKLGVSEDKIYQALIEVLGEAAKDGN